MKKFICLLALLCSLPSQAQKVTDAQIKWVTAELPPYLWLNHNVPQGYVYELIVAMSAQLGRKPDLSIYPWARAIKMTREGRNYGVFPLQRTLERESSYKWLIHLGTAPNRFFGKRSTIAGNVNIEHASIEQLRGLRVGIVRGSSLEQELLAENFRNIQYEKDYQSLLKLLQLGGLDAVYSGYSIMISAVEEYGFRLEDFTTGLNMGSAELYMASSMNVSEEEERVWRKAYEVLQKDGTVQRLRKKYFSWE
ncbi:substrate-binding periplasmic protein [Undibacterium umbellatum]|uniref:Transporter substrate-binding domain-containing protein n=1 Tax=Undibacterium umbellatum TaxID=2762300 RepID=A0ABR6ZF93_9BURK|nr:transporter substrate-binding domain-containing protein [Undibacterium umbellatum]MBC3910403.1 transporter substrate-binding domain-containing protein [Undibacterium umbellatum]